MSNEKRDYPEWLDEELFDGLPAEESPAQEPLGREPSGDAEPRERADESAPKKKKAKKAAPAESGEGEKRARSKPSDEKAKSAKKSDASSQSSKPKKKKSAEQLAAEEAERERVRQTRQDRAARALKKWLIAMIVIVSLALIVCIGGVVGAYLVTNSDTNLPNVYLDEVYVGGLTQDETLKALEEAGWEESRGGTLTVKLPEDVSFELDFLRAGACQPKEEAAEVAFRYGHTEDDWFGNLYTYIQDLLSPVNLSRTEFTIDRNYVAAAVNEAVDEFERRTEGERYHIDEERSTLETVKGAGEVTLDRKAICDRACALLLAGEHELEWKEIDAAPTMPDFTAIAEELNREVANAYYDPEKDEIIPESLGAELDVAQAEALWKEAGVLEKVSIPITILEPEITAESLKEVLFHDKLGDCLTYLWGSTPNRISNVRLACSRFDGLVLQPGERFSYNDVVGERTADAGFLPAPTYNGTAHEMGLGGGICQVSSTLYNAALYANLEINERVCHTMVVGYLPLGLDATVDWPDTNFVFTNNRDYPIKLKAGVDDRGRELLIEIWGTDVDGSYVDMLHYEWPAYDETYRNEYGLDVQVGYGARSIRRVYFADGSYEDGPTVYSYYHIPEDEINWPAIPTVDEGEDVGEEEG